MSIKIVRKFEEHPDAKARLDRAKRAITSILNLNDNDIHLQFKKDILRRLLYAWTRAELKKPHATLYQSEDACRQKHKPGILIHEHVTHRWKIVDELINNPDKDKIDGILKSCLACTVTRSDDIKLRKAEKNRKNLEGWDRYKAAKITVYNTQNGEPLNL